MKKITLLKCHSVCKRRCSGTSNLYADIQEKVFTPPLKRGRSSFWPEHEVDAILAAELAGASKDELKVLVAELVLARKNIDAADKSHTLTVKSDDKCMLPERGACNDCA